jgi:peroxiredoxin
MSAIRRSLIAILFVGMTALAALPKIGDRAPQLRLPAADGKTVELKDYAGKKKVILVFYRGYW